MRTYNFPTANIKVHHTTIDAMLVGPAPEQITGIWGYLIEINSWSDWVIGVDKVLTNERSTISRGSIFDVNGLFGKGQIEILRWDPEAEMVLMLQVNDLRLAFSILLRNVDCNTVIEVEGEYELFGWKNAFAAVFRLFLHRQQNQMMNKLDLSLNQPSSTPWNRLYYVHMKSTLPMHRCKLIHCKDSRFMGIFNNVQ